MQINMQGRIKLNKMKTEVLLYPQKAVVQLVARSKDLIFQIEKKIHRVSKRKILLKKTFQGEHSIP